MIVLDTHAWIWWLSSPEQLSETARRVIDQARENREIRVSSMSVWEMTMLVARGRLELAMDVNEWVVRCERLPFMSFVPVSNPIAIKAVLLPPSVHPDPADRMIIATAQMLNATLVTKDRKIRAFKKVKTVW